MISRADANIDKRIDAKLEPIKKQLADMKKVHSDMQSTVAHISANTELLVNATIGATKIAGFTKKHGPRVFAFCMGVAVAAGWLDANSAKALQSIIGL